MLKTNKKKGIDFEEQHLLALPFSKTYEKSYIHQDVVTHAVFSNDTGFLVTASFDGHIKLWKKIPTGMEFVKEFSSHSGDVAGLAISCEGRSCASVSESDETLKIIDILSHDLTFIIPLTSKPSGALDWCFPRNSLKRLIAVGRKESGEIDVFDVNAKTTVLFVVKIHNVPVTAIRYNESLNTVISTDNHGFIEFWRPDDGSFPKSELLFSTKTETDLFEMVKDKSFSHNINFSADGKQFVVFPADAKLRIYDTRTGKITRIYDESHSRTQLQLSNAIFDDSGMNIIYCSSLGIKIVNIATNRIIRLLANTENIDRFIHLTTYQEVSFELNFLSLIGSDGSIPIYDPTLVALGFQKHRFFVFTKHQSKRSHIIIPDSIIPNKKLHDDEHISDEKTLIQRVLPHYAVISTSLGEISVKLYPSECPLTVENFSQHAQNGYYDGLIFHRVIKGFIIQTGDPLGNGTGGSSIWGGTFDDEIKHNLCHDKPGILSMANAGPNTNGSQFFITTIPCPWLDKKHTIFGKVLKGMNVVQIIEKSAVDPNDKPYSAIKISHIRTFDTKPT